MTDGYQSKEEIEIVKVIRIRTTKDKNYNFFRHSHFTPFNSTPPEISFGLFAAIMINASSPNFCYSVFAEKNEERHIGHSLRS